MSADKDRRLSLAEGVDLRALPITPEDAFVLSRVDGVATEADIALATGLSAEVVRASLGKLAELGAVRDSVVPGSGVRAPQTHANSGTFHIGPVVETSNISSGRHPAASLYDPAELDEPVDLELTRKRLILDTFYSLEGLSHYELLRVDTGAEKKAIKSAYFELVNHFHPDRYFGKNLGSFKPKLERLFARVTEAHDVLTKSEARDEYDRYLASVRRTKALDRTLADRRAHATEVERVEREIRAQVQLEEKARSSYPPPIGAISTPQPSAPGFGSPVPQSPLPQSPMTIPPVTRPADSDARRRALARKLGVSQPPATRPSPAPVSLPHPNSRDAAVADLKRRYEDRMQELRSRQVQRYLDAAGEAEARRDLVSATNSLRIAASLNPDDKSLEARLRDTEARAASGLAESYLEQALYEERENRWLEAAASYRRAARGKPSPRLFERTAHCLLNGKGDLKEAADFAKRARDALPDDPYVRLTLGKIYSEAGMKQSAIAELERAQQLAPKDDTIKDWLRRARRGDA